MSTLVVIEYDDQYKAEEMRLKLRRMEKEYLIDLEDAVVAVKDDKGKIKLNSTAGRQWLPPLQIRHYRF